MAGEQAVAHRFVSYLVENITSKVGQIKKETQNETARFAADEVKGHCDELRSAVDTLFAAGEQQPNDPPSPIPPQPVSRRRVPNA